MTARFSIVAGIVLLAICSVPLHAASPNGTLITLHNLEFTAVALHKEADELVTIATNTRLSPDSHLVRLEMMKADINTMGREIATLESERATLPAWEEQAVAETLPLLRKSAKELASAITTFDNNRDHVSMDRDYEGYADALYRDSGEMEKILRTSLKLDKVRAEEHRLTESAAAVNADTNR